jgi:hypothetical protein
MKSLGSLGMTTLAALGSIRQFPRCIRVIAVGLKAALR